MLNIIRQLLCAAIEKIDSGNSNMTEKEMSDLITYMSKISTEKISKYQACQLLNVSRATFDNLVREGKMPKGEKQSGFKELFWYKADILKYLAKCK